MILQQSSSLKLEFLYDEKDNLYGYIKNNNERYYYIRDALGNILGIINQNGQIVVQYSYTSYGVCSISGNTSLGNENPFRYKGYYYDVETSLYYLNTRYYDPEIGRFISPDSVDYLDPTTINGLNLYAYCGNDPVNYADPSGHWIETVFDLFSLGASVVEVIINPANPWAWAGLVGDAVDLLPFVTGVGEGIRATKMVKYADDVIDASYDTIKFVKAADMVDDFSDAGRMLDNFEHVDDYYKFTVSNLGDGKKIHRLFMDNGTTITGSRLRVDGLNKLTNTMFELKPYNIRNARKGVKQILNYNDALGGGYKMIIVLY